MLDNQTSRRRRFDEPEQWRFEWERSDTRDEWLDQLPAAGGLTQAPPEVLEPILERVAAGIDAVGGKFLARCTVVVASTTRISAP